MQRTVGKVNKLQAICTLDIDVILRYIVPAIQSSLFNPGVTGRVRKSFNDFIGLLNMSCPMVGQLDNPSKKPIAYWSSLHFRFSPHH